MYEFSVIQKIAVWIIPVLFAITVHEVAHGWVASKLGDQTAKMMGRLTLNPIKHIDPIGTILIPALMLLLAGFFFGYAKPVPVTWQNLRKPKRDMAIVAAAGPMANLLMMLLWVMVIKITYLVSSELTPISIFLIAMGIAGIFANIILFVLNLLPLPPLDGGRIVTGLLPGPYAWKFSKIEPYGFFILIFLLITGILGKLLWGPIDFLFITSAVFSGAPLEDFLLIFKALMPAKGG